VGWFVWQPEKQKEEPARKKFKSQAEGELEEGVEKLYEKVRPPSSTRHFNSACRATSA
jgi:hypothetical protein